MNSDFLPVYRYCLGRTGKMAKRVYCLHRVSTTQQVDHTEDKEADIPLQRRECRRFAEQMGWDIVKEAQELGVSGFKISAENRDVIQLFKEDALNNKFDILLVFMFDRIGRISSETPFIVEWFVNHGVEVWSVREGQQRFDNQVDRLTNYIRFWQSESESRKTSERVSARMRQIVEDGHFKGGVPAFGYKLVKSGRFNKKGYELHDLAIDDDEAKIVSLIFDRYINGGLGKQALSRYLNERGITNRDGKRFHPNSITRILGNPIYYGVLTCAEVCSPIQEHLQIINQDTFEKAQKYRSERCPDWDPQKRRQPFNMKGKALLSGNIFCGHCGGKMTLSTARYHGGERKHVIYVCYQKNRSLRDCDGQTTYTAAKLDPIIEEIILNVFTKFKKLPQRMVIENTYKKQITESQALLKKVNAEISKLEKQIKAYQEEIIKVIAGKSAFSAEILNDVITRTQNDIEQKRILAKTYQSEQEQLEYSVSKIESEFNEILSWSEIFQSADIGTKKMICNHIIDRVDIRRGYDLSVKLNISIEQFGIKVSRGELSA